MAHGSGGRAFPNLCPYCGDEDLWPHEPEEGTSAAGAWECRSCLRAFSLSMLGQIARPGSVRSEGPT